MKSKKTLCIVILTVVCVGLMVLTGFLIAKTLNPGPFMPADTSKPSGEVNLKWETAFIEVKEDLHLTCGWTLNRSARWRGTNQSIEYS